jgi:hypothetical protein
MARRKVSSGDPDLFTYAAQKQHDGRTTVPGAAYTLPPKPISERSEERSRKIDSYPQLGTFCPVCRNIQFDTPGGACCINGHGHGGVLFPHAIGHRGSEPQGAIDRDTGECTTTRPENEPLEEMMWQLRQRLGCGFSLLYDGLDAVPTRVLITWHRRGMTTEKLDRRAWRPGPREAIEYVFEFERRRDAEGIDAVERWHRVQRARSEAEVAVLVEERRKVGDGKA